jgi:hypothetical protein
MMLEIDDQHPDASAPLLPWLVRYFEEEGAAVVIATGADNSLRSLVPGTGARFEVAVEGLPNLLHEALHAVQVGALADDHGIDYGLIPFDVTVPAQRRLLWQELACAAVSCGYLEDPAAVDPWFAEQIEIQGIFFGFAAEDLTGLRSFIEATIAAYGGELEAAVTAAYTKLEGRLRAVGAPATLAGPRRRWGFSELWARYRAFSFGGCRAETSDGATGSMRRRDDGAAITRVDARD